MKKNYLSTLLVLLWIGKTIAQTTPPINPNSTTIAPQKTVVKPAKKKKTVTRTPSNLKTAKPITTIKPSNSQVSTVPKTIPSQTQPSVPMKSSTEPPVNQKKNTDNSTYSNQGLSTYNQGNTPKSTNKLISNRSDKGLWVGLRLGGMTGSEYFSKADLATSTSGTKVSNIVGLQVGLVARLGFGKHISFQPEILYEQKGTKVSLNEDYVQINQNQLTVPLLFNFSFNKGDLQPFINVGGYGSYLMSGTLKVLYQGEMQSEKLDFSANPRRLEYGAVGGLGISYYVGNKGQLIAEGRYYYGLGNALGKAPAAGVTETQYRNVAISLGYIIKL